MTLSAPFIEQNWPLTQVALQEMLRTFDTRLVQRLTSAQGDFVIKTTNQWPLDEVMQRHTFIFRFLQSRNFSWAPQLLPTTSGQPAQKYAGQYVYILSYHESQSAKPTPAAYNQLGHLTAKLHKLRDYPYPYLFTVADVLPEMMTQANDQPFAAEYRQLVQTLPDFAQFPNTLIHGEILGNFVQDDDGKICILDWDEAGIGTRILDLGHPLLTIFTTEDLDVDRAGAIAFYRGYLAQTSLTKLEISHIFEAGLFYALRYIIYGDTAKRWQRVQFALANRDNFVSLIKDAMAE
ncbi:MAG: phosphotransferase [Chloroflexota bacterium]